ncbi:MAG: glycoside hydrolase family 3 protein [Clostridia bacterium]|nr:glycoside hydrolase family 3 protein [Clostridia bacterium]
MIGERIVNGLELRHMTPEDINIIHKVSERTTAEGCVLLKNNGMLPLKKGDNVAVFGRMQRDYVPCGWGSGGDVNVEYTTNIFDSLTEKELEINQRVVEAYREWAETNPVDYSDFSVHPRNSEGEMPMPESIIKAAAEESAKALIIITRIAGEGKDQHDEKLSYRLCDEEYELIKNVSNAFENTCVVLNTSSIIDMSWATEFDVQSIIYVWQGGQDGGKATADVLCGDSYPSGKLSDTIAYSVSDYPSAANFGASDENVYEEDIFVGYRYFETFKKDKVMYPFGYGLSYTQFSIDVENTYVRDNEIIIMLNVGNTGDFAGKETVQVYFSAHNNKISYPSRTLVAFAKSKELQPRESEKIVISFNAEDMAAYDDTGVTGNKSCYVLEEGEYGIYVGNNVRDAQKVYTYHQPQTKVTKRLSEALLPNKSFKRMINKSGKAEFEVVEKGEFHTPECTFKEIEYTGDRGYLLADVYHGNVAIEDFVSQLSDFDLACISQGEGMHSDKTRPGCVGAIGGLTKELQKFGIPAICVTDGPAGLRFDNGDTAVQIPIGTLLACTWNCKLVEELYSYLGMEAYYKKVDGLLGPGVNIHRHPLCGRNFEYYSEDPYLSGMIGKAVCSGLDKAGVTATVKHFAANNQEFERSLTNSLVSERALREIYLKPFEMIVKDGKTKMIMTGYNRINGVHAAGNYDLTTLILRNEWGYDGAVMTDWGAKTNENEKNIREKKYQIISQNDVYMVSVSVEDVVGEILLALEEGEITRAQLQRNAVNLLNVILNTPTFERYMEKGCEYKEAYENAETKLICKCTDVVSDKEYTIDAEGNKKFYAEIRYVCTAPELAQVPIKVKVNGKVVGVYVCLSKGTGVCAEKILARIPIDDDGKPIRVALNYTDEIEIKEMECYI